MHVALNVPDGPVNVPGDSDQLRQVFTNLLENALKYGDGKNVTIDLRKAESEPTLRRPAAIVTVCDEGPGIDSVHIPRMTERFYRVDGHRSREMGGTGLGLAIASDIILGHGGDITLEDSTLGGLRVIVQLPV